MMKNTEQIKKLYLDIQPDMCLSLFINTNCSAEERINIIKSILRPNKLSKVLVMYYFNEVSHCYDILLHKCQIYLFDEELRKHSMLVTALSEDSFYEYFNQNYFDVEIVDIS